MFEPKILVLLKHITWDTQRYNLKIDNGNWFDWILAQ